MLIAEGMGSSLATVEGAGEGLVRRALQALLEHLAGFEHRVRVEAWNGEPVLESEGQGILEGAGFYRDYPGTTWEAPVGSPLQRMLLAFLREGVDDVKSVIDHQSILHIF